LEVKMDEPVLETEREEVKEWVREYSSFSGSGGEV